MNTEIITNSQQAAAAAVQESERRYQRLLSSVTDYVYSVVVEDGRAVSTFHGPGCEAVTGYNSDEFKTDQSLWYRMIFEEDRPAVLEQSARIFLGETPPPLEHRIVHKNGSLRWIRNTQVPLKDERGRLIAYDGLVYDITGRKRAEIALRDSQERLELVIQGSNDGIWDWNLKTNEIYLSPRWKSMLGYRDDEVGNNPAAWEALLHPEDRGRVLASLGEYLEGRRPVYEVEHRLRHKDGSYRWILTRGVALRGSDGKPVRMAGSHVDLTGRKQAEEQLTRAYAELAANEEALKRTLEELRSANQQLHSTQLELIQSAKLESVGALAAGVAHEVKNPLQTILMGLDYLGPNLPAKNETLPMVLRDMRDAVTRANTITRGLLQLSAHTDFELKAEDLTAVVKRGLRLVNAQLIAAQIKVVRKLDANLPRAKMDRVKIEQVLINLCLNAMQAMPPGGLLTVTTRFGRVGDEFTLPESATRPFRPGDLLVVAEVQDTGSGISAANLPKIFDPFFTTKPAGVGTGLGLSVVRKIMDLHEGGISIENAQPVGVVVTLALKAEPKQS
jgi:PAS domain S-box-containing protein